MEENKEESKVGNEPDSATEKDFPKMAEEGIHAGFPAPATGFMERGIDLNRELIKHPSATFFGRAVGDSMIEAGVSEGDLLVIDRALEPQDGDMAVCFVDGEFTLKYLSFSEPVETVCIGNTVNEAVVKSQNSTAINGDGKNRSRCVGKNHNGNQNMGSGKDHIWLVPANPAYKPIRVSVENDFTVWGVVTYVIKKTK